MMQVPLSESYFSGGPWSGRYRLVEDNIHVMRVPEREIKGYHIYKEDQAHLFATGDRVFNWSGVEPYGHKTNNRH